MLPPPQPPLGLLPWLANYLKLKLLPFATARQKKTRGVATASKAKLMLKALHYGQRTLQVWRNRRDFAEAKARGVTKVSYAKCETFLGHI